MDRENKKLAKMQSSNQEALKSDEAMQDQVQKTKRLLLEKDVLAKDVALEQDKLITSQLALVSRYYYQRPN